MTPDDSRAGRPFDQTGPASNPWGTVTNEAMRHTWGDDAAGWVANEAILDALFEPATSAILAAADIRPGSRMLDIGCGSGTLLAHAADVGAEVVGIDISAPMTTAARARVPAATVVTGDAQSTDLLTAQPVPGFDRVVSRFGVMFFAVPTTAFTNIRRATGPGGRLVFACWRTRAENPMFTLGTDVLTARISPPLEMPAPGDPGPTAFADPSRLATVLAQAGWAEISVTPLDFVCDHGYDGSDGVESRLAVVLGTSTGRAARARLEPMLGTHGWAALLEDVRAELRRHLVDGALRYPGACWLVTAHNPDHSPEQSTAAGTGSWPARKEALDRGSSVAQ